MSAPVARRSRWSACSLAAVVVLAPSCHDEDPSSSAIEGEHVEVYAEPELVPCGGTMAHMDAFVISLAQEFSLALPTGADRIRFHWLAAEAVAERCGPGILGCVINDEVFASELPVNHELVHVVAAGLGEPPPFFSEGLAVAYQGLSPDLFEIGWAPEEPDLRVLLTMPARELAGLLGVYELIGAFSAFLIETYGLPAYLQMYGALAPKASVDEVDAVFREVFGASFEETAVAFDGIPAGCPHQRFDAKLVECAAPEVAWDGVTYSERLERACEQDDAIGPYDDQVLFLRTITIPAAGPYELRMAGVDGPSTSWPDVGYGGGPVVGVSLVSCGGCDDGSWLTTREGDQARAWSLSAGRYALRVHAPAGAPAEVGFSLTRVDDGSP